MTNNVLAFRLNPCVSEGRITYLADTVPTALHAIAAYSVRDLVEDKEAVFITFPSSWMAYPEVRTSLKKMLLSYLSTEELSETPGWIDEATMKLVTLFLLDK